jgi:hypothetical protein
VIDGPTVLVLGAGASAPFKFPTGKELLINVARELREKNNDITQLMKGFNHSDELIYEFSNRLVMSQAPSIDRFLVETAGEGKFKDIGRQAIAFKIAEREQSDVLMNRLQRDGHQADWYEHVLNNILSHGRDGITNNKLKIVTFNYDRSLEHYLAEAFKAYGFDPNYLLHFQVLHVYGFLGPYPAVPYAPPAKCHPDTVSDVCHKIDEYAKRIKIMTEQRNNLDLIAAIEDRFKGSENVVFLGCGYHQENLDLLQMRGWNGKAIYGSASGLGEAKIRYTKALLEGMTVGCDVTLSNHTALDFLKNTVGFI